MKLRRLFLSIILCGIFWGVTFPGSQSPIIIPTETIKLFNGKDLTNFYTWLVDKHFDDPERVFSVVDNVDGAPAIRVSGERWGAFITKNRYANYRLIVEFRWGLLTWDKRRAAAKDSGILLHGQGSEGNMQKDFNAPWMRSIECQIIEGGVGDILLLNGYEPDGTMMKTTMTAPIRKDRDGETVYDMNGTPTDLTGQIRINWFGRDEDWADKIGFRGKADVESETGKWTTLEVICKDGDITNIVNGKVVAAGTKSNLSDGKILFQSEGAEIFFRRIDLEPLKK